MEKQTCRICGEIKLLSLFELRKDTQKYRTECKDCKNKLNLKLKNNDLVDFKLRRKKANSKWYRKVKAKGKFKTENFKKLKSEKAKKYYNKHKEYVKMKSRRYRMLHREAYLENGRKYYQHIKKTDLEGLRKRRREYMSKKCESDFGFKFQKNMRKRIWDALKGNIKSARTMDLIDLTIQEFEDYISSKFYDNPKTGQKMTIKNFGEWHVDHIIPCSSFDLSKPEEQRKCFHYTNLQPLWKEHNFWKSDKILNEQEMKELKKMII